MASKRKRKLEMKAAQAESSKMDARREAFNDNLWTYGLPIGVAIMLILVVYFGFFYTLGPANADEWELEEAETGTIFGIYLTYAEAFIIHQWCPFCLIAFGLTLGATFFSLKTYGSSLREFIGGNNGV